MDTESIQKSCRQCSTGFTITTEDLAFYEKVSPVFNGKKELIPPPTLCPECRQRRRLAFRNERKLYKRKCDLTGKDIVSIYSPDKPYKVYDYSAWWGDGWDATDFGRDFDFSKTFSEQFSQLAQSVPYPNVINFNVEDGDYANYTNDSKRLYLTFGSGFSEDLLYSKWCYYCNSSLDCLYSYHGDFSYECVGCDNFYACQHCANSKGIRDCAFCHDCQNCHDCFLCIGLRGAQYYILNKPYSKEEYTKQLADWKTKSPQEAMEAWKQLRSTFGHDPHLFISSEACTGYDLNECSHCRQTFNAQESEDLAYTYGVLRMKDCMDVNKSGYSDLVYESISGGYYHNVGFTIFGAEVADSYYTTYCTGNAKHLFACVGLKGKEYCILNKQYTREEYEALVPKIIAHMRKTWEWGEFFSPSLSPFGYNETVAAEYFPLEKEEALKLGFNWSDYEAPFPKVEKTIPAEKLPEDIAKIPDDILNWAIVCEVSGKPFRVIKQELEFYRKHNLPIPKRHPDQRHADRMALRNPRKLWERHCDCAECQKNNAGTEPLVEGKNALREKDGSLRKIFQTTYAPERPEKVYCEVCYNHEVYG